MLNDVDLDMGSAFCYNPDFNSSNQISLGTRQQCGLFIDRYTIPAANSDNVVLDEYTGHAFDGRYHYHGGNHSLSNIEAGDVLKAADITCPSGSPVIGFEPDGFPIYGHYFCDSESGLLRKAVSSRKSYSTERTSARGAKVKAPSIDEHPRECLLKTGIFKQEVAI